MLKWQRGTVLARRPWLLPLGMVIAALLLIWLLMRSVGSWFEPPDPTTIVQSSLQSMREQNRMIVLSSRMISTPTTTQRRGPFSYSSTMIMPGEVRYELDMAKLSDRNLRWDGTTNTLSVTLPPLELSAPQIDLPSVRALDDGGILRPLIVDDEDLRRRNQEYAIRDISTQAASAVPMRAARDNAKRVMARNFALPLRAAGVEANVEVRFADEPGEEPSYVDQSRSMSEVLGRPVEAPAK